MLEIIDVDQLEIKYGGKIEDEYPFENKNSTAELTASESGVEEHNKLDELD